MIRLFVLATNSSFYGFWGRFFVKDEKEVVLNFFCLETKETKIQGCVLDFVELLAFAPLPHPNSQTALAPFLQKADA